MERLQNNLDFDNNRFLFLYGEGVEDSFISTDYRELQILEVLWHILKNRNYDCILYYSTQRGLHFLDNESRAYCRQEDQVPVDNANEKHQDENKFFSGPLGKSLATHHRPPSRATPRFPENFDLTALGLMDWLMNDTTRRSAVIINQAETSMRFLDDALHGSQASRIGSWARLPHNNKNICILLFSTPYLKSSIEENRDFVPIPEIVTYFTKSQEIKNSRSTLKVPGPEGGETLRLLDYSRLLHHQSLNWAERVRMAEMIAFDGKGARLWLQMLAPLTNLSIQNIHPLLESSRSNTNLTWREELDRMEGLEVVKSRIKRIEAYVKRRQKMILDGRISPNKPPRSMHLVFLGNPGTGKTTVARLIGEMYRDLGLLKNGRVNPVKAEDLIAEYEGATRIKTNEQVDKSMDGVLFIDEAHQLTENNDVFGKQALGVILTRMENDRDRLAVIVAGYTNKIKEFLKSDVGLSSRFPESNHLVFPDYEPDELMNILRRYLVDDGRQLSEAFERSIREVVENLYNERDQETFGNARKMRELADDIGEEQDTRLADRELTTEPQLEPEDIPTIYQRYLLPDAPKMDDLLSELNTLVGLERVKVLVQKAAYRLEADKTRLAKGKQVETPNMNMCFIGNPGTGKTTVARMMGKIYHSVGRLRSDKFKEIRASDLIAGYVGQTSGKAEEAIKDALDGVLFIDEAYALDPGNPEDTYKKDAINKLMQYIDAHSNRMIVILAGYPEQMERLLNSNPGLTRRFPKIMPFDDYSDDDLLEILRRKIHAKNVSISPGIFPKARTYFLNIRQRDGVNFGNAGVVNTLISEMEDSQNIRYYETQDANILDGFDDGDVPDPSNSEPSTNTGQTFRYMHYDLASRLVPTDKKITKKVAMAAVGLLQVVTDKGEGTGTGFVVTPQGHVLTAWHVIDGARRVTFRLDGADKELDAEVIGVDQETDLAVLRLPNGSSYPWIPLAEAGYLPNIDDEIVAIGYPLGKQFGKEVTYVRGTISSLRTESGRIQIAAPVTHGSSGGPVCLQKDLRVVGAIHGGAANQPGAQMNFATNIQLVYVRFGPQTAKEG